MAQTATLSTIIDSRIKRAATAFCKKRGLKLRYLVEQALLEQLEDELDLQAFLQRRNEDTISFEDILASRGRRK
jgi:antitoxin component of RelBE/YafQ-DinJ toxin-antitoxin module